MFCVRPTESHKMDTNAPMHTEGFCLFVCFKLAYFLGILNLNTFNLWSSYSHKLTGSRTRYTQLINCCEQCSSKPAQNRTSILGVNNTHRTKDDRGFITYVYEIRARHLKNHQTKYRSICTHYDPCVISNPNLNII